MKVLDTVTAMQAFRGEFSGGSLGLVPTMGALHAGHLSLVDAATRECGFVVVTIFVNPAQFGPNEDFTRYPRTLEADLAALAGHGVDLVFAPTTESMYRPGHATYVEMLGPALPLEGAFRPGHFRGVATIVLKLFNLVQPDRAYFGRKDYQQALLVRRMVDDLNLPLHVEVCPIAREPDGLAMSSRNVYLSAAERQDALAIPRALQAVRAAFAAGERHSESLLRRGRDTAGAQVQLEYLELVDAESLQPVDVIAAPAVCAIAAQSGATRLIDNVLLEGDLA